MSANDATQKRVFQKIKDAGIILDCTYCDLGYGPDNMEVHLIVDHDETAKDARNIVDDIVAALPLDDDDNPLGECLESGHGFYRLDYGCDRCEEYNYKAEGKNEA